VSLGTSSGTSATRCSPGTVSFGTLTITGIDIVRILLARYSNPAHESCDSPIRKEGREFLHAFCPLAWRTVRHPKPLFNTPPTRKVTRQTLGKTKHSTSHRFPYQETLWGPHFYTCLRWVRLPLEEVRDAPEFVKAKVREIANLLPDASFTVEQLRSEKKIYDPFLIVSYADESYYVEVWEEPEFEQMYT